jgi:hypothetical protein
VGKNEDETAFGDSGQCEDRDREIGVTVGAGFLILYGMYRAWEDFIVKLSK